jgi:hypothetical protein
MHGRDDKAMLIDKAERWRRMAMEVEGEISSLQVAQSRPLSAS